MQTYLDFEKGLAEIEGKAEELRALARKNAEMDVEAEAQALDRKADTLLDDLYRGLDPGGSARWPATRTGRIAGTISTRCSANGRRWPETATLPTITP